MAVKQAFGSRVHGDFMLRVAIKSRFEAYLYVGGRVVRLWCSEGNVRHLIRDFLVPLNTNPDLRALGAYEAAVKGASEDTIEVSVDVLETVKAG